MCDLRTSMLVPLIDCEPSAVRVSVEESAVPHVGVLSGCACVRACVCACVWTARLRCGVPRSVLAAPRGGHGAARRRSAQAYCSGSSVPDELDRGLDCPQGPRSSSKIVMRVKPHHFLNTNKK